MNTHTLPASIPAPGTITHTRTETTERHPALEDFAVCREFALGVYGGGGCKLVELSLFDPSTALKGVHGFK